ncbi:MAG: LysE family transporter [Candidatus Asgardarchaeia archaeon]
MLPLGFIFKVVSITSSGALSPGPLTASTVISGTKSGYKAGFMISVGHTIVEFPLVILIAIGIAAIFTNQLATKVISLLGSIMLFFLAYLMIKDLRGKSSTSHQADNKHNVMLKSPIMIGITLSAFNPYFIVWWIFVGGALAVEAYAIAGFMGVFIMYVAHVWMDYVFLMAIAFAAYKGKEVMKTRGYKALLLVITLFLVIFGIDLLMYGLIGVRLINI